MDILNKLERISFLFPLLIALLIVPAGFLIKHFFFQKKNDNAPSSSINAGGNISAGGDVIVGNKNISNEKDVIKPELHISPLRRDDRIYAELYNTGNEDVSNLSIVIYWKQEGNFEKREMYRFFNETEDPVMTRSHKCEYLRKNDKKIIAGLPMYSDDGKIKFVASGIGVKSKTKFCNNFFINNIKYSDR